MFQGDSITDGNRYKSRASEWEKTHQIGHSYAYIVTGLLGLAFLERHYEFIDRGISGNRTDNLLTRWEEDAFSLDPDVLSVLVGINDCLYYRSAGIWDLSAADYERNYVWLLTLSREKHPR